MLIALQCNYLDSISVQQQINLACLGKKNSAGIICFGCQNLLFFFYFSKPVPWQNFASNWRSDGSRSLVEVLLGNIGNVLRFVMPIQCSLWRIPPERSLKFSVAKQP